ncbi:transposase [Streptomyces sp. S1]|uniref:transposase n=1 Tax=Streptomyces sp. S1 TaxID=718288 RepID=UPI003D74A0F0
MFTAVVYALTSSCAWRHLPPTFGTLPATAHRRFTSWTEAGLRRRPHRPVLDELGTRGEVDRTSAIIDRAEPCRSRQERQRAARVVGCPGHPARRRRVRRESDGDRELPAAAASPVVRPVRSDGSPAVLVSITAPLDGRFTP